MRLHPFGRLVRAAAVLAMLLLAGCSGGGSPRGDANSVSSTSTGSDLNATLANATPVPTTDTLYLLRAPSLNATLPENETVIAVKGAYNAQTFVWNRTLNSTGNLSGGHLRLWLLLPHSAVQQGAANDPGCTIHWILIVSWNGTQRTMDGGCGSLGMGTVPPGEYGFNITAPPITNRIPVGPGADLRIQATVGLVQPNGGAAYLMGGTGHFDSHLQLTGLAEPAVDPVPDAPQPPPE